MTEDERLSEMRKLREELELSSVEARIVIKIADNLRSILKEDIRGMDLLLKENLLTELYQSTGSISAAYTQLERVVDLLAHENATMSIIEVGAGTGGATRRVLPVLNHKCASRRYSRYVFSDVTPSFLAPAQEQFGEYKDIEYKVFDMEQGAKELEGQFDLVLASQVRRRIHSLLLEKKFDIFAR
jgi:SAM-dependent methyltransferase